MRIYGRLRRTLPYIEGPPNGPPEGGHCSPELKLGPTSSGLLQARAYKMDRELQAVDSVFKALADPTRVRILGLLAAGEICVCHIHESLRLSQTLVSRHLAYLRRTGLVETRKTGLWVYYRLAPQRDEVARTLVDCVSHCIGQLPAVTKDRQRLEKKTGCTYCPPTGGPRGGTVRLKPDTAS